MNPAAPLLLLLFLVVSGCFGPTDPTAPAAEGEIPTEPPRKLLEASASFRVILERDVELPGAASAEPSIAASRDGSLVLVGAPAAGAGPRTLTEGGYAWVSTDGGETYSLALDPNEGVSTACSCDTDVAIRGEEMVVTTMYYTVNPAFNVNVLASRDGGKSWDGRSFAAADELPVDRHWITVDQAGDSKLLLTHRIVASYHDLANGAADLLGLAPPLPSSYGRVVGQASHDGGHEWSAPAVLADKPSNGLYWTQKPVMAGDVVLAPLQHVDFRTNLSQVLMARSTDGGRTFSLTYLSVPFDSYASFDFSVGMDEAGRAVVAWSQPDDGGVNRLHVRSSVDFGGIWSDPKVLPIRGTAMQPSVEMSPDGRVAIGFYGSEHESSPLDHGPDSPWYAALYVDDANLTSEPAVVIVSETVHTGPLCNASRHCPGTRSPLLEFLDVAWAEGGVVFVAYTDASPPELVSGRNAGRIHVARLSVVADEGMEGSPSRSA